MQLPAAWLWGVGMLMLGACASPTAAEALGERATLEASANAGQAEAAFKLGLDYDLGSTGPADPAAALAWYRRAARSGFAPAEFNVAVMLDGAAGRRRDPARAALWYARAAAHGHERAAYDLGLLYAAGDGVPRNPAVAEAWFRAASTLPAATRKLISLTAATDGAPAAQPSDAPLLPPLALRSNDSDRPTSGAHPEAELVWTAPAQPAPVRFFVEVVALDGAIPRRLFAGFTDTTATVVQLERATPSYAWRVYAVDAPGGRYAVTPWARFGTGQTASSG